MVRLNNVEKYLMWFELYTYVSGVIDIVLSELSNCSDNEVTIEIKKVIYESTCIFGMICKSLGISCYYDEVRDTLKIEVKTNSREELSKVVRKVLNGFEILKGLESYKVLNNMELIIKVCNETIRVDVEVEK